MVFFPEGFPEEEEEGLDDFEGVFDGDFLFPLSADGESSSYSKYVCIDRFEDKMFLSIKKTNRFNAPERRHSRSFPWLRRVGLLQTPNAAERRKRRIGPPLKVVRR